jgi:hypothetical protein
MSSRLIPVEGMADVVGVAGVGAAEVQHASRLGNFEKAWHTWRSPWMCSITSQQMISSNVSPIGSMS